MHLGRLEGDAWDFQTIHEGPNWGFYPVLVISDSGRVTGILHFLFDGYQLIRSFPDGQGGWKAETLGMVGDGASLMGLQTRDGGKVHLAFQTNRFNNEVHRRVVASWDPKTEHFDREATPSWGDTASWIGLGPGGEPIVLRSRLDKRGALEQYFEIKRNGVWSKYADYIEPHGIIGAPSVGPRGVIHLVAWDAQQGLTLWTGKGKKWTATLIARQLESDPNRALVRFDSRGRPVILVGRLGEPFGWLRVLRTR